MKCTAGGRGKLSPLVRLRLVAQEGGVRLQVHRIKHPVRQVRHVRRWLLLVMVMVRMRLVVGRRRVAHGAR